MAKGFQTAACAIARAIGSRGASAVKRLRRRVTPQPSTHGALVETGTGRARSGGSADEVRTDSENQLNETLDSPLDGAYPFTSPDPEEAVVLHDGSMEVAGARRTIQGSGRVVVRVVDGLDLRWDFDGDVPWGEPVRLRFHREDGSRVDVPAAVTNSAGSGYIQYAEIRATSSTPTTDALDREGSSARPFADSIASGGGPELAYVLTHWFNMPSVLPSSPLAVASKIFAGRWEFEAEGWRLTLDERPDHRDAMKRAKHTSRSTMTHVGKLERRDGAFSVADAKNVVAALEAAVSFAVGAWVGVALPVGYDESGRRVWEQWANWRCSPPASVFSWWSTHRSYDLTELCASFVRHWLDPKLKDCIRFASFHSISASSDRATLEAKVMVAQAGIEYLAWVTNVLEGPLSANSYKTVPAEEKIRLFLGDAGIPTTIPREFAALRALVPADKQSGPQAATWVRNRLVHPKDPSEPYRIENALAESWLLSREYLDLLILHRLGYAGHHVPYRPGGWAHATEPVPWLSDAREM